MRAGRANFLKAIRRRNRRHTWLREAVRYSASREYDVRMRCAAPVLDRAATTETLGANGEIRSRRDLAQESNRQGGRRALWILLHRGLQEHRGDPSPDHPVERFVTRIRESQPASVGAGPQI